MTSYRRLVKPAVWAFYIVIGLEFLFMISPFALFFYSSYGDVLNFLHRWPATAWLTGFFLPHISMTTSPLLAASKTWGFGLAALGLLLFVAGVIQIYGARLLRRREVTGGLYRLSRHPQYLALAVLGFGVLLIWPRYLVLLAFVTMLFLYYLLARWEEQLCLERYGESYREYMAKVGFLGPARLTSWMPSPPRWTRRPWAVAALYLAAIGVAVAAGSALRDFSLSRVSSHYTERAAVLSPAILEPSELRQAYELALAEPEVGDRLATEGPEVRWLVYVVPAGWYLADLPLDRWEEVPPEHRRGHTTPPDFEHDRFKLLFTKARSHRPAARGREIVATAYGRVPVLRVRVDLVEERVLAVERPPASVVWGDIPTPLY